MKFHLFIFISILSVNFLSAAQDKPNETIPIVIQIAHVENQSDINIFIPKLERQLKDIGFAASLNIQSVENHILLFIESSITTTSKSGENTFAITLIGENETVNDLSPVLFTRFNPIFMSDAIITASPETALEPLVKLVHISAHYFDSECDMNLEDFDKQLIEEFTQAYLHFIAGTCAIIEDDFDSAIEHLTDSLSYDLSFNYYSPVAPTTNLAWIYVQLAEAQTAIDLMNNLVKEMEKYPLAYPLALQKRAQIYALTFDYTSAIDDMNSAIKLIDYNPWLAEAYKQRGDIIMLIYEWNRALDDYNTAIELDPDYAEAYYRRGILLYTMVERENAIADFETYLELDPEGQFVESATEYIDSIQTELGALGG